MSPRPRVRVLQSSEGLDDAVRVRRSGGSVSNWPTGMPISSTAIPDSTATHHDVDWYSKIIQPISDSFVSLLGDPGFTPLTLAGAWVYYGSGFAKPGVTKNGDWVRCKGLIKNGALGALFTLPVGYRPASQQNLRALVNATAFGVVSVATSGVVTLLTYGTGTNGFVSLDDINFDLGA